MLTPDPGLLEQWARVPDMLLVIAGLLALILVQLAYIASKLRR